MEKPGDAEAAYVTTSSAAIVDNHDQTVDLHPRLSTGTARERAAQSEASGRGTLRDCARPAQHPTLSSQRHLNRSAAALKLWLSTTGAR